MMIEGIGRLKSDLCCQICWLFTSGVKRCNCLCESTFLFKGQNTREYLLRLTALVSFPHSLK